MRIALMADLHANRAAVEACLAHAGRRGAERYVFLGDYVGYGADPGWVVETIRNHVARGALAVLGNHDHAIAEPRESMNANARIAIDWTRERLDASARAFLAGLPTSHADEARLYIHAGGAVPRRWTYVVGPDDAASCLAGSSARLVFCGHVHIPAVFAAASSGRPSAFTPVPGVAIPLLRQRRWVAVLGSVGQPRDGDPSACYALLDTVRDELTYERVPYDIDATAARIRAAGLPEALAARLFQGL